MDFLYFLTHTVFTNQVVAVDNTKTLAEVMRPDGVMVPSAVVGSSDEVTYWIPRDGGYVQVNDKEAAAYSDWLLNDMAATEKLNAERAAEKIALDAAAKAQSFVSGLVDHFTAGSAMVVDDGLRITQDAMREAVLSLPNVMQTITAGGYSEAQVWAYAQAEAPWAVDLVGIG